MPMPPLPEISRMTMAEIVDHIDRHPPAPVERWQPAHCGDSEMRIDADGGWHHQGSPIGREAMMRKFASILRREADGGYVLVTPAERLDILVEDAPFTAVAMRAEGGRIAVQTNVGDLVILGPNNPLRMAGTLDAPRPYVLVRGSLEARVTRALFYELVDLALTDGDDGTAPVLASDGSTFALSPAA